MSAPTPSTDDGYTDVLFYGEWLDCPRSGVTVIDGEPMHFDCQFSEELDDYPSEFLLWLATESEVASGVAFFKGFAEWRGRFDAGKSTAAFAGQPIPREQPPASARLAVPEWRLDPDRSFANRVPRHRVRWRFLD